MRRILQIFSALIITTLSHATSYDFRENGIGYTITDSNQREVKVTFYDSAYISVPDKVSYNGKAFIVVDAAYYDSTTCSLKHYDKIDFSKATNIKLLRDQTTEFIDIDTLILPPNINYFPALRNITGRLHNRITEFNLELKSGVTLCDTVEVGIHRVFSSGTTKISNEGTTTVNQHVSPYLKYKAERTDGVFSSNTALQEVDISTHTIYSIALGAFSNSPSLKKCKLPKTIKRIDSYAFFCCYSLSSINLEELDELEELCPLSFYATGLDSFYIGKNVSYSYCETYYSNHLKKFVVNERNKYYRSIDGVLFDYSGTKLIAYPSAKQSSEYIIPEGTEVIGFSAFGGCANREQYLEQLTFASSINKIEHNKAVDIIPFPIFYAQETIPRFDSDNALNELSPTINISKHCPLNQMATCCFVSSKIRNLINLENTQIDTIPGFCFSLTNIEHIRLPASFKRADNRAFAWYKALKNIDFSLCGTNTVSFGKSTFYKTENLSCLDFSPFSNFSNTELILITPIEFDKFIFPHDVDTTLAKQLFSGTFFTFNVARRKNTVNTIVCPFDHPWDVISMIAKRVQNGNKVDTVYVKEYYRWDLFYYVDRPNCTLIVPEGSVEEFKAAPIWQEFKISTGNEELGIGKVHAFALDPNTGTVLGGGNYPLCSEACLTAYGKGDYVFDQWSDGNTDNPRMYFVSKGTATIYAKFRKKKAYTLTIKTNCDTLGTVSGSGTYFENDIVRLTATPREGYRVESWSFAPYSRSEGYNFVMPSCDTTVTCNFGIDITALPLPADTTTEPIESGLDSLYSIWQPTDDDDIVRIYTIDGRLVYSGTAKQLALPRKKIYILQTKGSAKTFFIP